MVFDHVMGVGKTPQVTQTPLINPYSLQFDDITAMAFPVVSLGAGSSVVNNNPVFNITNPNLDWYFIASSGFSIFQINKTSGGFAVSTITWDLGKEIIVRGISSNYNSSNDSVVTLQGSSDGLTWENYASSAANGTTSLTISDKKFRYLRYSLNIQGTTGGVDIRFLKLQADTKQLIF